MRQDVMHHYKRNRAFQLETYSLSGLFIDGKSAREFTGGGAAYGYHALSAYKSATSHLHFMKTLKADLAAMKKRSKASRKGWARHRANA